MPISFLDARLLLTSSLQVPRPMMLIGCFAAQNSLERLAKLWTEHSINDGIQRGIEVSEPKEERDEVGFEVPVLEDGHEERLNEEGKPAGDEGAGHDRQSLGCLPLSLGLQGHVFLLLPPVMGGPGGRVPGSGGRVGLNAAAGPARRVLLVLPDQVVLLRIVGRASGEGRLVHCHAVLLENKGKLVMVVGSIQL